MPTLVLLNGAPGIGKSTLARRFVADRPLAFCLDLDGIRRLIGQWDRLPAESGGLARRMALAMAGVALMEGRDVVMPQYVADVAFIEQLEALAGSIGAGFAEILLTDSKPSAVARFFGRRDDDTAAVHQQEAESQVGGEQGLSDMYDRLLALSSQRPNTQLIPSSRGDVDGTYRLLLSALV